MSNNRYISEQISIYDWTLPRPIGADAEYFPSFDYKVCVACAAGFSYGLDTTSMRTIEESEAGARSLTLGMASLIALPVYGVAFPARVLLTGGALGSVFDGAGQLMGDEDYRPGQTFIAGYTGVITGPLTGYRLLSNMAVGGVYGGSNTALNNFVYGEDNSVRNSVVLGMAWGGAGTITNNYITKIATKNLPYRIGGSVIDPNYPILLQNTGVKNPYPQHIGTAAGEVTSGGLPLL